mmetsp:Transcript_5595/g.22085  ORF Transcript_5595/g.22085 Transcript_5595/m.22085 type:complete len:206 (-) Transcript_5595:193-810(-)
MASTPAWKVAASACRAWRLLRSRGRCRLCSQDRRCRGGSSWACTRCSRVTARSASCFFLCQALAAWLRCGPSFAAGGPATASSNAVTARPVCARTFARGRAWRCSCSRISPWLRDTRCRPRSRRCGPAPSRARPSSSGVRRRPRSSRPRPRLSRATRSRCAPPSRSRAAGASTEGPPPSRSRGDLSRDRRRRHAHTAHASCRARR